MSAKTRSIHSRSNPKDFSRIFKTRWASWGVIGLLWIPFILLVLPILESSFAPFFRQIGIFFVTIQSDERKKGRKDLLGMHQQAKREPAAHFS